MVYITMLKKKWFFSTISFESIYSLQGTVRFRFIFASFFLRCQGANFKPWEMSFLNFLEKKQFNFFENISLYIYFEICIDKYIL